MEKSIKFLGILTILSIMFMLPACNGDSKKVNEETGTTNTMIDHSQMSDSSKYACPMHKNMMGMKGDKCTECGMDLEEMTHTCPMHNNMVGMKGDKCTECGMDLEEMKGMKH